MEGREGKIDEPSMVDVWRRDLRIIEIRMAEDLLVPSQYPLSSRADAGILGPHCTYTHNTVHSEVVLIRTHCTLATLSLSTQSGR